MGARRAAAGARTAPAHPPTHIEAPDRGTTHKWGLRNGSSTGRRSRAPGAAEGKRAPAATRRAGFVARGVVYVLVGALALRLAFGDGGPEADRQGASQQIAARPFRKAMLWMLVVGFGCMAIRRGSRALLPEGPKNKVGSRLLDGGRAVFHGFVCRGTASFAAGTGRSSGSDAKSRDRTAPALRLPGGQALVTLADCVLVGVGVTLAARPVLRRFLRRLETGRTSRRVRQVVTGLGVGGGAARGAVFAGVGVFVLVAAVRFDPRQAKDMDAARRLRWAGPGKKYRSART